MIKMNTFWFNHTYTVLYNIGLLILPGDASSYAWVINNLFVADTMINGIFPTSVVPLQPMILSMCISWEV